MGRLARGGLAWREAHPSTKCRAVFTYAFDAETACVLFLFSGKENVEDDWKRYLASIDDLEARARGRKDSCAITFIEEGNEPPPAKWRRLVGERSAKLSIHPVAVTVSTSRLLRGISTLFDWFAPNRFEEHVAMTTFEEAVAWIELRRGPRRSVFNLLMRQARAEADRRRKAL